MRSWLKLICCYILVFNTAAYANTFSLTATNLGNGQVAIGYEETGAYNPPPVGLALNVTLTNGAVFTGVVSESPYFPIHPDTLNIDEAGQVINWGSPVAAQYSPGSLGGLGTSGVTLEMVAKLNVGEVEIGNPCDLNSDGYLDYKDMGIFVSNWLVYDTSNPSLGDINCDGWVNMQDIPFFVIGFDSEAPPLNLSQLLVLQIDLNGASSTTMNIAAEDVYRGGIVAADGSNLYNQPVSILIPEPAAILLLGLGTLVIRKQD